MNRLITLAKTKLNIFQNKLKCVKNVKLTLKFCSEKNSMVMGVSYLCSELNVYFLDYPFIYSLHAVLSMLS